MTTELKKLFFDERNIRLVHEKENVFLEFKNMSDDIDFVSITSIYRLIADDSNL